jgi:hypothetical protein
MTTMTYVGYAAAAALTVATTLTACGGGDHSQGSPAKRQASLEVYAERDRHTHVSLSTMRIPSRVHTRRALMSWSVAA